MKSSITFFLICVLFFSSSAQYRYPLTKTVDSSDTYFGVTYKDPYRWLENLKDPEAVDWFKQQADFSNAVLNNITGRDELIAEWKMLDKLQPPGTGMTRYEGARVFYLKIMPGENFGKLYYRQGIMGKEQLLFDPTTYIKGKKLSIQAVRASGLSPKEVNRNQRGLFLGLRQYHLLFALITRSFRHRQHDQKNLHEYSNPNEPHWQKQDYPAGYPLIFLRTGVQPGPIPGRRMAVPF
ncbi:hypothetical protein [Flavihumibacter profundi]|uniref:hypothetical protein n=1 Tax=Flavihumibacter profundi TaxID=2716883 RepID=UPI001CC33AA3|nr:hypothetical protein [Flavihumibacter profundi]MBZ5857409.1 hypothetical protein [Flavihumibacter profundi]